MSAPPEFLSALIAIADPASRRQGVADLMRLLDADACIIFIRDPELDVLLPAPGFPQTLPGRQAWRLFLDQCVEDGMCEAELPSSEADDRVQATGLSAADESVLVLFGPHPDVDRAAELCQYLPLLTATLRQQYAGQAAAEQARVARERAAQLGKMASALETTRLALQEALQVADEANERMEHELGERKRTERALKELNETLEERIEESTSQVRQLAYQLTLAEQRERRRIAQILHDELQQLLVALQLQMSLLVNHNPPEIKADLEEAESYVAEALDLTRNLALEFSAPTSKSETLEEGLTWLADMMKERYGLQVKLEVEKSLHIADKDMRELLYQLLRELLFNVVKHAGVNEVELTAREQEEKLFIRVEDEGHGFDVAQGFKRGVQNTTLGLYSVRERLELFGGRMELDSALGEGTRVTLILPIQDERAREQ